MSEADRLNASVGQLLSFSRPPQEEPGVVNVSALVERIVHSVKQEQAGRNLELGCRAEPGLLVEHAGNQSVEQSVWNLVLNAVQAVEGNGQVEVTVEKTSQDRLRLQVLDNGPGIPAGDQQRIFEPYFTSRQKGTGLGLSIVEKNVRQLHGTVIVRSPVEKGRGTCFTVELPCCAEGVPG